MTFHPFTDVKKMAELSEDDLLTKLNDLNRKYYYACSRNIDMANQILMMINDYQDELSKRHKKHEEEMKKRFGSDFLDKNVNIVKTK